MDDFDDSPRPPPEALDTSSEYKAPTQEPAGLGKRRLSGSLLSNQGKPQEKEKLIAKDGDVGYDSDEGFTKVKKETSSNLNGTAFPPSSDVSPRTPTPEMEEVVRTPTPEEVIGDEEEVIGDNGGRKATTPPVGSVSGGARYDDNDDAYSDDFDGRHEDTQDPDELREAWPPQ